MKKKKKKTNVELKKIFYLFINIIIFNFIIIYYCCKLSLYVENPYNLSLDSEKDNKDNVKFFVLNFLLGIFLLQNK